MLTYDQGSRLFCITRADADPIDIRFQEGWIGGDLLTIPREAKALIDRGLVVTRDPFLAAMFIQIATPEAKAVLKSMTKHSWEWKGGRDVLFPRGVVPYDYQKIGVHNLLSLFRLQRGAILGDSPGLGKTMQIIGVVNEDPTIRSVLVVCPATIRLNWAKEFAKFGTRKDLTVWQMEPWIEAGMPPMSIVITNYERLGPPEARKRGKTPEEKAEIAKAKSKRQKRSAFCRKELLEHRWDLVALDESHKVKNGKAAMTKAVYGLLVQAQPKARAIFASGTPITKNPMDLQIILEMINKQRWHWDKFTRTYCTFTGSGDSRQLDKRSFRNLAVLNCRLRLPPEHGGCMIRRLKEHVLSDLPSKVRRLVPISITGSATQREAMGLLVRAEDLQAQLDWDGANKGSPVFDKHSRIAAEREISQAFDNLAKARVEVGVKKIGQVVEFVNDLLEDNDEKVIVFAHHREVVAKLEEALAGYGVVKVVGGMSVTAKQASVDAFQAEGGPRVFIGNYAAAGVGITLTRASKVVCAELDWTPAIMEQAEDRAYRIGQVCTVFVDILFADETIDSILLGILNRKREEARDTLDEGKGNGEDVIDPGTVPEELRAVASGKYATKVLDLYDSFRKPLTRNHLRIMLAAIEGEKRA